MKASTYFAAYVECERRYHWAYMDFMADQRAYRDDPEILRIHTKYGVYRLRLQWRLERLCQALDTSPVAAPPVSQETQG